MESISAFDIFKIGLGPSSSHTMGPWMAAHKLIATVGDRKVESVIAHLYGSLAKTGLGHGTDVAIMLGLSGLHPRTIQVDSIASETQRIRETNSLLYDGKYLIDFNPLSHIRFHFEVLPFHPNGMRFEACLKNGEILEETYYSIGGGFVVQEGQATPQRQIVRLPYPVNTEADLQNWIKQSRLKISEIVFKNEESWRSESEIRAGILEIWEAMLDSIYRGCSVSGQLPGGLAVQRRASKMSTELLGEAKIRNRSEWLSAVRNCQPSFANVTKWVSCFALAVNEENASFGRVVTAPTNGAAGVIPAVLLYYLCFCSGSNDREIVPFLLTASEIGCLFKKGATISAAMGGCQAEIGVSSAMAAAGLTECMGGTQAQVLMAAEIAMEHHLGLTCDPINGLVQIPCIERNTMGAMKAITAAKIALSSDPGHARVSLDGVIATMWETAMDMNSKYKETSDGGLATNIPVIVPEC